VRRLAFAILPLALLALVLPVQASAAVMRTAAAARPDCLIPILCPSATPTPTPTPSASASATPTPTVSADPTPTPSASPSGTASASPSASASASAAVKKASSVKAAAQSGLTITEAQFSLTTGSAVMGGAVYDGTAEVPTASGGTVEMLKFSMSSLTLSGSPTLTVSQGGQSSQTSASSMQFTGNVVLYATELSGHLLGIPITLTPGSPLALFTSLLNGIPLTGVTTDSPLISSDSLSLPGLQVSTG
jgi:hypothetical protein